MRDAFTYTISCAKRTLTSLTRKSIHQRVALHKHNNLAGSLRTQVIPTVVRAVVYAGVLSYTIWIYEVGRLEVLVPVDGGGIAEYEWPIIQWSFQWLPEAWSSSVALSRSLGVDSLDPLDSLLCQFIKVLATVSSHFLVDFARCTICSGSAKIKPVYLGEVLTYVRDSRGLIVTVNLSLIFFRPSGTSLSDL
jgi:predicted TIM-barrel enzyme